MKISKAVLALLLATLACGRPTASADVQNGDNTVGEIASGLASSLEVEVTGGNVRLVLRVTNPTDQPITLEFSSGQQYDFAVREAGGADVWRWSADKSFMQMLSSHTLSPGDTLEFAEVWNAGDRKGSFEAIGALTSSNRPIEETARFEIR